MTATGKVKWRAMPCMAWSASSTPVTPVVPDQPFSSTPAGAHGCSSARRSVVKLQAAQRAGKSLRLRITATSFMIGLTCIVIGCTPYNKFIDDADLAAAVDGLKMFPICLGIVMLLLTVLPTDRKMVRLLVPIALMLLLYDVSVNLPGPIEALHRSLNSGTVSSIFVARMSISHGMIVTNAVVISFCFLRGLLRLHPCELLELIWCLVPRFFAIFAVAHAIGFVGTVVTSLIDGDLDEPCNTFRVDSRDFFQSGCIGTAAHNVFAGVSAGVTAWITRKRTFRTRAQAWLAMRGGASRTAATIAMMIGGQDANTILHIAKGKFRCIPCNLITEDMIQTSQPDPTLYALSQEARLHEVDGFFSHSWSDNAAAKWAILQAWREEFKKRHGREPTLWIDKFCIDQTSIDENLLCLPVFLSGCNKLIIAAGKTYLKRMWCVLEYFAFIEMGGNIEDLDLWLMDTSTAPQVDGRIVSNGEEDGIDQVRLSFQNFDARNASCHNLADKDRLLSIVDAGCGGLDMFNSRVQEIIKETMTFYTMARHRENITFSSSLDQLQESVSHLMEWDMFTPEYDMELSEASEIANPSPLLQYLLITTLVPSLLTLFPFESPEKSLQEQVTFFIYAVPLVTCITTGFLSAYWAALLGLKCDRPWVIRTSVWQVSLGIVNGLVSWVTFPLWGAFPIPFIQLWQVVGLTPFYLTLWWTAPLARRSEPGFRWHAFITLSAILMSMLTFAIGFVVLNTVLERVDAVWQTMLIIWYLVAKLGFEQLGSMLASYLGSNAKIFIVFIATLTYEYSLCIALAGGFHPAILVELLCFDAIENAYHLFSLTLETQAQVNPEYVDVARRRQHFIVAQLILREFLEFTMPTQFLAQIIAMRQLQPRYNKLVCSLTDAEFHKVLTYLSVDMIAELIIGLTTYVMLRRLGFAPLRMLRGLLATWMLPFLLAASAIWMYFSCVQHSHYGADVHFKFKWLRDQDAQWHCGLEWHSLP